MFVYSQTDAGILEVRCHCGWAKSEPRFDVRTLAAVAELHARWHRQEGQ